MCGINGVFAYHNEAPPVDMHELRKTRDAMVNRGPDGFGDWMSKDKTIGLAHRRLSIIDLSKTANQPMATFDSRYIVVFNGEIYNYQALRDNLSHKGATFKTHSDTEVLLYLYQYYGSEMLHQLRGMFAFAIWDEYEKELFVARDRYGIKPFYYSDDGKSFKFASQVKALLAGGAISPDLDPAGATGFLLWGSVPEPFTICKNIKMLPAGSYLKVTKDGLKQIQEYWSIPKAISLSMGHTAGVAAGEEDEYVLDALMDTMKSHMVADVPVGAFLSGGLDSSAVVAYAQEFNNNDLQTFTLGFEEFKNRPIDEAPIAEIIAKSLGTQHRCEIIDLEDFENEFPQFLSSMDQPTIDGLNTWFISKATIQAGLKVVLSGLGGDELLGGYPTFHKIPETVQKLRVIRQIPWVGDIFRVLYTSLIATHQKPPYNGLGPKTAGLIKYGTSYDNAYQLYRGIFMPWELPHILDEDFMKQGFLSLQANKEEKPRSSDASLQGFGKVAELEGSLYMRNQLLRDTDWVGMAHSLEIRVPLVDHILTEKIIGLALEGRIGSEKSILNRLLSQKLPSSVLNRPKTGFTVPIWRWLNASQALSTWKKSKFLSKTNIHTSQRLAFSILSTIPQAELILKNR